MDLTSKAAREYALKLQKSYSEVRLPDGHNVRIPLRAV